MLKKKLVKKRVNSSHKYFSSRSMASNFSCFIVAVFFIFLTFRAQAKGLEKDKGAVTGADIAIEDPLNGIFPFVGAIDIDSVNIRAGQSENFEKICELKKGDLVVVVGKSYSWYKIEIPDSAKSYVSSQFIRAIDNKTAEVIGSRVNIRSGPGTNHSVLGQLKEGNRICIVEELDQWYRIKPVKGTYGWVSDKYISFKGRDIEGLRKAEAVLEQEGIKKNEGPPMVKEAEKKVDVLEEKEIKAATPDNLIINKDGSVSITGYLRPQKDSSLEFAQYKLEIDKNTFYYIEGFKYIFDEFLGYKVVVDGTINKDLQEKYKHPVITVTKIELVL